MKKALVLLSLLVLSVLFGHQGVQACVGKTLYIGVSGSPSDMLFAEMVSVLVNERTGTTVKIITFKDAKEMYGAVKKGEVGVVIESAGRALKMLQLPAEGNPKAAYESAKREYRKSMNLVWLDPFGVSGSYAAVLSVDTIGNLPALPKLINKLGGVVNDETHEKLLKSLKQDEKAKKVARDFLKAKKLI